jgi:hypothetical protein
MSLDVEEIRLKKIAGEELDPVEDLLLKSDEFEKDENRRKYQMYRDRRGALRNEYEGIDSGFSYKEIITCIIFTLIIVAYIIFIVSTAIKSQSATNEESETTYDINENFDVTSSGIVTYKGDKIEVRTLADNDTGLEYILVREVGTSEWSIILRSPVNYDDPYLDPYDGVEFTPDSQNE